MYDTINKNDSAYKDIDSFIKKEDNVPEIKEIISNIVHVDSHEDDDIEE